MIQWKYHPPFVASPFERSSRKKVLEGIGILARAQKLDIEAYLRIHPACQFQQYSSWHHAVTAARFARLQTGRCNTCEMECTAVGK